MADQVSHDYDTTMLDMLQIIWGEGYLSPGGPQAVRETMAASISRKARAGYRLRHRRDGPGAWFRSAPPT